MTDTEINIAIAEACGWKHYHLDLWVPPQQTNDPDGFSELQCDSLPDYTTDLNAMHEAEKTLIDWVEYRINLSHVVGIGYAPDLDICDDIKSFLSATAAQRAEAFLKTIGKWKD